MQSSVLRETLADPQETTTYKSEVFKQRTPKAHCTRVCKHTQQLQLRYIWSEWEMG